MSEMQDIRAWARANGYDVADKGRLAGDIRQAWQDRDDDSGDEEEGEGEPMLIVAAPLPGPEPIPVKPEPGSETERPPAPPPVAPGRRKGLFARQPTVTRRPGAKPKARPRVSIENILSSGWALGAMALARKPEAVPVARIMDMQAPVAGIIGDELLRGTVVDRILQPLARGGAKAEMAVALACPPLLVGVMTARPETFPVLRPLLKMSMMTWLEIAEPAMAKVQKRQATWTEKFGDIDLDAMIDALWAGLPESGPVSEQEEEHVRRARGDDS
jgi:hypothetical protein